MHVSLVIKPSPLPLASVQIVDLMLILPESEQKQVSEAIAIIGRSDFPAQWPSLLPSMLEKFALGDFHIINGVLRTAHSLFRRYRYEYACDELFTEILEVLGQFAKPLTELFKTTIDLLAVSPCETHVGGGCKTHTLALKIFLKIFLNHRPWLLPTPLTRTSNTRATRPHCLCFTTPFC